MDGERAPRVPCWPPLGWMVGKRKSQKEWDRWGKKEQEDNAGVHCLCFVEME